MTKYFEYDGINEWSSEISEHIAIALASDIRKYGKASLALSGGSSPKPYLEKLASYRLPWNKIFISLTDERHVPHDDPDSNEAFIREYFLEKGAGAAKFLPLYRDNDIQKNLNIINQNMVLNDLHYSVIVLGMGADGHTASLFPESYNLDEGLFDPVNIYSHQEAPSHPTDRISMNMSALTESRKIFITISGQEKKEVMLNAMKGVNKNLPISFVLASFSDKITIFGT